MLAKPSKPPAKQAEPGLRPRLLKRTQAHTRRQHPRPQDKVVSQEGRKFHMKPDEYAAARVGMGLTGYAFAQMLGISPGQGYRYEADKRPIPHSIARFIRTILGNSLKPEDVG
jgi:hypothetical protein